MMVDSVLDKLAGIATLGTRRAPLPREIPWPDASLASAESLAGSPETRLLRAVAAGALFEGAGARAATEASSAAATDFPDAGAPLIPDAAARRLARIACGEYPYLLREWFGLAAATGRVLPPRWLPLVLEHVPAPARAAHGAVLGPAARWLATRQGSWTVSAPVTEASDLAWQEGSLPERLAALGAVRRHSTARARDWLLATWPTDPPDAREAFLRTLIPTIEPEDEALLEQALDDKRKGVRQAAAEGLARLPGSALARRMLDRADPLLSLGDPPAGLLAKLRKRKLAVELPAAPDKSALRDGIEAKVPAARKMGERAFWLEQTVSFIPPRHWCERFSCDAETFLDATMDTDFGNELLDALTEATARHPEGDWLSLLARTWLASGRDFQPVSEALQSLATAASPADRAALIEALLAECKPDQFGLVSHMLESLEFAWSASLTHRALGSLEHVVVNDSATYAQTRNALDAWARHCDVVEGMRLGAALSARCGEQHRWRNALEQFNEIVAFRAAMHEELRP